MFHSAQHFFFTHNFHLACASDINLQYDLSVLHLMFIPCEFSICGKISKWSKRNYTWHQGLKWIHWNGTLWLRLCRCLWSNRYFFQQSMWIAKLFKKWGVWKFYSSNFESKTEMLYVNCQRTRTFWWFVKCNINSK